MKMIEKTRAEILNVIPFDECVCVDDINTSVPFAIRTVYMYLKQLTKEGFIKKIKSAKDMRKTFYKRIK